MPTRRSRPLVNHDVEARNRCWQIACTRLSLEMVSTGLRRWTRTSSGRAAVALAVLVVLATGFCLFDRGQITTQEHHESHEHGPSADLCGGLLAPSVAMSPVMCLLVVASSLVDPGEAARAASPHVPDPPPKNLRLARI
jgi:hypothetical protein